MASDLTAPDVSAVQKDQSNVAAAPAWLIAFACACVALGIWLRFSNIDTKYSYVDEMYTSIHAAGFAVGDLAKLAPHNVVTASQLVRQFESPTSTRGPADAARVLAVTDPTHPPIYYFVLRADERVFGDSLAIRRAVSAAAGVALLGIVFWLGLELFGSMTAALVCAAVVAVSPYQLVFSQFVREWMLFELLAACSALILLKALRSSNAVLWVAYAVALALALYTSLFEIVALLGFAVYVLLRSRIHGTRGLIPFAISSVVAFLLIVPWLVTLGMHWTNAMRLNQWNGAALPLHLYAAKLVFVVTLIFFDAEYLSIKFAALLALVALAAAVAAYRFVRDRTFAEGRLFVLSVVGTSAVVFIGSDLVLRASRATQERYLTFTFLIVEIGVACGAAAGLTARGKERAVGTILTSVLLAGGLVSCLIARQQKIWWENNNASHLAAAAQIIDSRQGSLGLATPFYAVQLSDMTRPSTRFALDASTALRQTRLAIYAFDPNASVLRTLRASRHEPGQNIDLVTSEQTALKSIHASVMRAHKLTASQDSLFQFDPPPGGTR
jgi:uncharacterized membrane protein